MVWHQEGVFYKPDLMVHPADGEAWNKFDEAHPEFACEARNVRLGLAPHIHECGSLYLLAGICLPL